MDWSLGAYGNFVTRKSLKSRQELEEVPPLVHRFKKDLDMGGNIAVEIDRCLIVR